MSPAFDLPKALSGSMGHARGTDRSHGALVPIAEFERTLLFAASSVATAVALCSQALGSMFDVSSAAFLPGRGVAIRLEGLATSVESPGRRFTAALEANTAKCSRRIDLGAILGRGGRGLALREFPVIWRLSVTPGRPHAL
ncbi:MAG: hypothetical protein WDM77_21015 [Steroidobacteraceae bacterium]